MEELPADPVERAIYGDALAVYEARMKEQAAEGRMLRGAGCRRTHP